MTSATTPTSLKHDPIRERYFKPLARIELVSTWLFYAAAVISLMPVVADKHSHPRLFEATQVLFILSVFALFFLGLAGRIWAMTRAHDARRADQVSNAFSQPLTHERTDGYYNNEQTDPIRRLGVTTMESAFYTHSILRSMAWKQRAMALVYLLAFMAVVLYRGFPYEAASIAAQVVFSEQLIARVFRLEWMRVRSRGLYEQLHSLFQTNPTKASVHARSVLYFAHYEASKESAAVSIPDGVFQRMKPSLDRDWERIRAELNL